MSSEEFVRTLSESNLTVNWELPELHTLPKFLTRPVDPEAKEVIVRRGIPFKTGRFDPDEDLIISKNWKTLCKKHKLPPDPGALANWRNNSHDRKLNEVRRFAILWLAKNLPDRTPAQVYRRFLHLLGCPTKGRYTEIELEIIESFIAGNGDVQTQQRLGSILGRDEPSIWRRIKLIRGKNFDPEKFKKIKWTLEMDKILLKNLLFILNRSSLTSNNIEILRTRKITWEEWNKVSKETKIPALKLKVHWNSKLYVQLFCPHSIYLSQIMKKLLHILKNKNYSHWVEVNWEEVSKNFEFLTPLFLWTKFYFVAVRFCRSKIKNLKAVVEHLHENFIIQRYEFPKLRLQRIEIFENEELRYVK